MLKDTHHVQDRINNRVTCEINFTVSKVVRAQFVHVKQWQLTYSHLPLVHSTGPACKSCIRTSMSSVCIFGSLEKTMQLYKHCLLCFNFIHKYFNFYLFLFFFCVLWKSCLFCFVLQGCPGKQNRKCLTPLYLINFFHPIFYVG